MDKLPSLGQMVENMDKIITEKNERIQSLEEAIREHKEEITIHANEDERDYKLWSVLDK